MKYLFGLALLFTLSTGFFCSCMGNDNEVQWTRFNGIFVTVSGNEMTGYQLYTDFDAVLVPTIASLEKAPWLKKAKRAMVSFNLTAGHEETMQLEAGKTYDVELNTATGMMQELPTYTVFVDTASDDYLTAGQDSINLKNEPILALDKRAENFYVKNGFLNVLPTFDYVPYTDIYSLLYYDAGIDVDVVNKKLTLHLYFNNNTEKTSHTISPFISYQMPWELYYTFQNAGMADDELIDVCLEAPLANGTDCVQYRMMLKDFLIP